MLLLLSLYISVAIVVLVIAVTIPPLLLHHHNVIMTVVMDLVYSINSFPFLKFILAPNLLVVVPWLFAPTASNPFTLISNTPPKKNRV